MMREAYQKLKKSLISLSLVDEAMFLTLMVDFSDMMNVFVMFVVLVLECCSFICEGYQACSVEVWNEQQGLKVL
jgi:hypothetical protein